MQWAASELLIRREIAMNQKRKGTKSAKEEFFALFASLRFYRYQLIFSPRFAIPLSSPDSPNADQDS
jgi:hypothetical protein